MGLLITPRDRASAQVAVAVAGAQGGEERPYLGAACSSCLVLSATVISSWLASLAIFRMESMVETTIFQGTPSSKSTKTTFCLPTWSASSLGRNLASPSGAVIGVSILPSLKVIDRVA